MFQHVLKELGLKNLDLNTTTTKN